MNCRTFTLPCHQRRWITPDSSGATPRWRNSWGCPTPCLRLKAGSVSGAAKRCFRACRRWRRYTAAISLAPGPASWATDAGILLGEQQLADGRRYDWHLKGAGLTPYSRMGDGRAVLRSTIRESLASEAMHALGIPTTRALAMVTSDTPVYRERVEPGAMLMRVAESHVRFGHFEHFYYRCEPQKVQQLADYVIRHHWPQLQDEADKYLLWFRDIVMRTAQTIASWQTVGFAHGVMNTDNMSILGLTIDYGPYGFLDDFQPDFICNHSDYQGRYSFENQPAVGLWNLQRLAQSLSPFISAEALNAALDEYQHALLTAYGQRMRDKLGLFSQQKGDNDLLDGLFALMIRERRATIPGRSAC